MLAFEHPEYLFALGVVPIGIVVYLLFRRWQRRKLKRLGEPRLVGRQFPHMPRAGVGLRQAVVLILAAALTAIGFAALRGPGDAVSIKSRGVEVIVALDVSKSMLATDVPPSRMDRARQCLLQLLNKLQGQRVGLILFAGRAYLQSPVTTDYGMLRTILQTVGPGDVPSGGTAIGEALRLAGQSYNTKERVRKVLLLVTDGETHDGATVDAVQRLAEDGIQVHTLGVGSPQGTTISDPVTGAPVLDGGRPVISKLDEPGLQQMAKAGGGTYTLLRGGERTATALSVTLNSIKADVPAKGTEFEDYTHYYPYFLLPALLMLLLDVLPAPRRSGKKPLPTT